MVKESNIGFWYYVNWPFESIISRTHRQNQAANRQFHHRHSRECGNAAVHGKTEAYTVHNNDQFSTACT